MHSVALKQAVPESLCLLLGVVWSYHHVVSMYTDLEHNVFYQFLNEFLRSPFTVYLMLFLENLMGEAIDGISLPSVY